MYNDCLIKQNTDYPKSKQLQVHNENTAKISKKLWRGFTPYKKTEKSLILETWRNKKNFLKNFTVFFEKLFFLMGTGTYGVITRSRQNYGDLEGYL